MEKLIIKACDEVNYNNYKSFNELIERLEDVKDAIKKQNYGIAMDILCKSYPEFQIATSTELKESEDKQIMKEIAEFIYNSAFRPKDIKKKEKWLTWLEKQGEQKPAIIIQKFRVGDEIKTNNEESLTITKIDEKGYWSDDLFICSFEDSAKWELVEQKPAWSEEDEVKINRIVACLENLNVADNDILLKDISWLKSLKGKVQPKQEWSEEDEQYFKFIENLLVILQVKSTEGEIKKGINSNSKYYYEVIQWLKSLKNRINNL